ncbi:TPA: hypothetical protein ACLFZ6_001506 [Klebsiella pneumoniae]
MPEMKKGRKAALDGKKQGTGQAISCATAPGAQKCTTTVHLM